MDVYHQVGRRKEEDSLLEVLLCGGTTWVLSLRYRYNVGDLLYEERDQGEEKHDMIDQVDFRAHLTSLHDFS
jgi:hypothetical protein